MSVAHRPGEGGGGGYYGGGGGDVLARPRGQGETAWRPEYYQQEAGRSWPRGGTGGGASVAQNSYSGYSPDCWSCSSHPRPPYPPNYPVGDQRMEPYANGSYGSPYAPASMSSTYPNMPADQYFPSPSQASYPEYPYKQSIGDPQVPPPWGYPPQHGCHSVSTPPQGYPPYLHHQQEAVPPYPYQETSSGLHQPTMPQQTPQSEGWGVYGGTNHYPWPTAPPAPPTPASSHYIPGGRSPWPGHEMPPSAYDLKDPSQISNYNRQRPYQTYHPEPPQTGPPSEPKPTAPPNPHYSGSPQMYNRKEPPNQDSLGRAKEAASDSLRNHPAIVKISQVLEKVVDLEKEVDEFVGRKTDMSYRYLEELLTKELLELDSVETGGQDIIRQARKEAVKKLQLILERLERKGL
ncbi:hypothetical protein GDO86_006815 [Hymenochirus boettgeri]|uniref:BAG domain-containing protein n=1 Tax=Hymenochirus boettgeri TaxID=247094 RepID=A0A8T2JCF4_9PIPI|nr:hypothetical protein GDO86_006815 [Hymenochirus boettgeri]